MGPEGKMKYALGFLMGVAFAISIAAKADDFRIGPSIIPMVDDLSSELAAIAWGRDADGQAHAIQMTTDGLVKAKCAP
jgi:hypothetical protein